MDIIERNQNIKAEYEAGLTLHQLKDKYGLSPHWLTLIIKGQGGTMRHAGRISRVPNKIQVNLSPDTKSRLEALMGTSDLSSYCREVLERHVEMA